VRKTIIIYGISLAALALVLSLLQYRYLVMDLSIELYIGIIATIFTAMGIWVGTKIIERGKQQQQIAIHNSTPVQVNQLSADQVGLSPREADVLALMADGLSNQEIADKLFVSLSTVKTHSSNLFVKLDVKRRTQAIQKAKELGLIM
jgi:DNA-binding NarL/FixJ family response regulator